MKKLAIFLIGVCAALLPGNASAQTGALPIGSIVAYGGDLTDKQVVSDLMKDGWLPCNGGALYSADPATKKPTQYALLFSKIKQTFGSGYEEGQTGKPGPAAQKGDFNLPDCRGRFLRGVDMDAGGDHDPRDLGTRSSMRQGGNSGMRVGSIESDSFAHHTHPAGSGGNPSNQEFVQWTFQAPGPQYGPAGHTVSAFQFGGIAAALSATTGDSPAADSENRPVNLAVHWIIRYK